MNARSARAGVRPFRKVLVANRGEIAIRVMRTCRQLGIASVAIYSDADRDALHVRAADEAVRVGPALAAASYLSIPAIVRAARESGAEAVHPGYGFASESAAFAEACAEQGLTFVGPPPAALRAMGDKAAARHLATQRGIEVVPGFDTQDASDKELVEAAVSLGFPVMLKAVGGGGGRGMRLVLSVDALAEALAAARREALAAFGDGRLLLERAIVGARHIEFQVLGDRLGHVLHLGERDCSLQRRHQKVVEEAPAPGLSPELRARMGAAAVELAGAAGYSNAGTVEFLLARDGAFYFLEMNARLQVEHGVTELVTGLDLVEWQLRIAAGEPLPWRQPDIAWAGHAIECRVYAEDPARGFAPSPGRLSYVRLPEGEGVRVDSGVGPGSAVPPEYDPLLAKVLVHGRTRHEALARARRAIAGCAVAGVRTNLGLLEAVLGAPVFEAGASDISTLEAMPAEALIPPPSHAALLAAAAHELLPAAPGGAVDPWAALGQWRIDGTARLELAYRGQPIAVDAEKLSGAWGRWRMRVGAREQEVVLARWADGSVEIEVDGVRTTWTVQDEGSHMTLLSASDLAVFERPSRGAASIAFRGANAGGGALRAILPGTVTRVLASVGDHVRAGQVLAIVEAMKIENLVEASVDGVVRAVLCHEGQRVIEGELLIEIEPDGATTG